MTKQSDEECESQGLTINAYQEKAGNAAFPVTSSVIVETEVSSADTLSVNTETPTLNMPNTEIHLAFSTGSKQFSCIWLTKLNREHSMFHATISLE